MSGRFLEGLAQAHAEIAAERAKTGGPAFPSVALNDPNHPASEPGMLLRDWFAGQALAGISANRDWTEADYATIAGMAYQSADAMLAARAKGPGA